MAFRFIAANEHPDHDTIAAFRRRFLPRIEGCSSRCCCWPARWACSSWARWRSTAPRSSANASRHSALSYEHAAKIEAQLKAEVADLMAKAEAADQADSA